MMRLSEAVTGPVLAVLLALRLTGIVLASPPTPTYGTANVDGDISDWDLTNDFFANMFREGLSGEPTSAKMYLRYDCSTQTMYALVKAEPGYTLQSNNDAWFALNDAGNAVVTQGDGNNGTPPDFAWVPTNGVKYGYEASFSAVSWAPSFTLRAQIKLFSSTFGAITSRSEFVTVLVACPPRVSSQRSGPASGTFVTSVTISDTVFLTGTGSIMPAGTVQFFLCQSANGVLTPPNCSTGGSALGAAVAVAPNGTAKGTASSINVHVGGGSNAYCFRAEFTPAAGSAYLAVKHSNTVVNNPAAECFIVSAPTAVTVSSFEASSTLALATDGTLAGMGLAGILALGGVALIVWRKR